MYQIEKKTHTSDIRLFIRAESIEELLIAGMHALSNEIAGEFYPKVLSDDFTEKITFFSHDNTSLLIDFLSDLLALSQIHHVVFWNIKFLYFDEYEMEAEVTGTKMDDIAEEIKAVTYHEADVVFEDGFYQTNIIFDI